MLTLFFSLLILIKSILDDYYPSFSGFLDCLELQAALSSGGIPFSLQTVNILLAKHDRAKRYRSIFCYYYCSGQLGFEEFKTLLEEVWKWKVTFTFVI